MAILLIEQLIFISRTACYTILTLNLFSGKDSDHLRCEVMVLISESIQLSSYKQWSHASCSMGLLEMVKRTLCFYIIIPTMQQ